jgi:hypothetical protein
MNVSLAAQTLTGSVADDIEFMNIEVKAQLCLPESLTSCLTS